jgi:5S rRNA maturation endonuclease (ribonuclease M5)
MREEGIHRFLDAIGVEKRIKQNNWIMCHCPLAPLKHEKGVDSHPSFSISIADHKRSVFYCFGCSEKAQHLEKMFPALWALTGEIPVDVVDVFREEENFDEEEEMEEKDEKSNGLFTNQAKIVPIDNGILSRIPLLNDGPRRMRDSMRGRGINRKAWERLGVRYVPGTTCWVFPFTDSGNHVMMLRARKYDEKSIFTLTPDYFGRNDLQFPKLKESGAWFGLSQVDGSKTVCLVEGELDQLRMVSLGYHNVVASGSSKVTEAQIRNIPFRRIMLGYDSDKAGQSATHKLIRAFKDKALVSVLNWSMIKGKKGKPCKDAGDMPDQEALVTVLDNARMI